MNWTNRPKNFRRPEPRGDYLLDHPVPDMRRQRPVGNAQLLQPDAVIQYIEKPDPAPQQIRGDMDQDLIDQTGRQRLLAG